MTHSVFTLLETGLSREDELAAEVRAAREEAEAAKQQVNLQFNQRESSGPVCECVVCVLHVPFALLLRMCVPTQVNQLTAALEELRAEVWTYYYC